MKYKSELIKEIVETRGHNLPSPHYESECVESWIEETKGAYPKLCDYESEWLNYINENHSGDFSYETITVITEATVHNAVPYAYKSAILKGNTDENLQSVKMPVLKITGKNLFDAELEPGTLNSNTGSHITTNTAIRTKDFIELSPNKTFSISKTLGTKTITILIYNNEKKFVRTIWNQTFTLKENERYIKITDGENNLESLYQIEEGSNITPFESFKSNILTVNEDVTLRSNGDVYDELNLLTGRLTQRIDENNEVLAQEVVKTVALTPLNKPYKGTNHYHLTANIPCEAILEVPVVSTGKQTIEEINN